MSKIFYIAEDVHNQSHIWVATEDGSNGVEIPDLADSPSANFIGPRGLFQSNGKVFFQAYPSSAASYSAFGEPFVSDGTPAGTFLLKDIRQGDLGSAPVFVATLGAQTLFFASDSAHRNLYATDGTTAGTILLASGFDANTNGANSPPDQFTLLNGKMVFAVYTPASGRELWSTDGTAAGTQLIKDIYPGAAGSEPKQLTVVGNVAYFSAMSPSTQAEGLWSTDGTAAGTHLVKDIYPTGYGSLLSNFTPFHGKLYFAANNSSGTEIWVSDGTTTGTVLLKDIYSGGGSSGPNNFTVAGDTLFFSAQVPYVTGNELYATDGTAAGTRLVRDINPGSGDSSPKQLHAIGARVVFTADDGVHGRELWASDGTAAGTVMLADLVPGIASSTPDQLTASSGLVFFTATDPTGGGELWVTDGTAAGTHRTKDIFAGTGGSDPTLLTAVPGGIEFSARSLETGREAWFSNGTDAGTHLTADAFPGTVKTINSRLPYVKLGDQVIYQSDNPGYGGELWTTDNTAAGAHILKDVAFGSEQGVYSLYDYASGKPSDYAVASGKLYYVAKDRQHGEELWVSDGTTAGTHIVKDVMPGPDDSHITYVAEFGGKAYFGAYYAPSLSELWVTDGTDAGTHTVRDPAAAGSAFGGLAPQQLFVAGSHLFFVGFSGTIAGGDYTGAELFVTDGTSAGTHLVKDINTSPYAGAGYKSFGAFGDKLLFTANDSSGNKLWISDGTTAGTFILSTAHRESDIGRYVILGGQAFYTADDSATGEELWVTDGTTAGTHIVRDLNAGAAQGASDPTVVNGKVYFSGLSSSAGLGYEPYVTDGTAAGTVMLKDTYAGYQSGDPYDFTALGTTKAVFIASVSTSNGLYVHRLWVTDGTAAGTHLVAGQSGDARNVLEYRDGHAIFTQTGASSTVTSGIFTVGVDESVQGLSAADGSVFTSVADVAVIEGGDIVFRASTAADGLQLWRSDGTTAGTHRVTALTQPVDGNAAFAPQSNFVSTAPLVPPTIGGTAPAGLGDHDTVAPFASVTVADPDNASISAIVAFDPASAGGFTPESMAAAGFTSGSLSGTPATVQAGLRQLVFAPQPYHTGPGVSRSVTLTLTVVDGTSSVHDSATVLTVTGTADAPTAPDLTAASDSGSSATDDLTKLRTPSFTGFADAGSTVRLYDTDGATVLATAVADADTGAYSLTSSTLAEGAHDLTVKATGADSAVLASRAALHLTVDVTPPAQASLTGLAPASQLAVPNIGVVAGGATPTLTGVADPFSTVSIYEYGYFVRGTATADASGAYSVLVSGLTGGTHALTAVAADPAGNVAAASAAVNVRSFDAVQSGDELANPLTGTTGADLLIGNGGDDVLVGGFGADVLWGGGGADIFRYGSVYESYFSQPDTIVDFQHGMDRIDLGAAAGSAVAIAHYGTTVSVVSFAPNSSGASQGSIAVYGDVEISDVAAPAGLTFYVNGGAADDRLETGSHRVVLRGGAGADTFVVRQFADSPGGAADLVSDFQHGQDIIDLTGVVGGSVGVTPVPGGARISFAPGSNGVEQGALMVTGAVQLSDLRLAPGTVAYMGGTSGNDRFETGPASGVFIGGAGADTLVVRSAGESPAAAPDTFADFQHGQDRIDLSGSAGAAIGIQHGPGSSFISFDPDGTGVGRGALYVGGDVQASDLVLGDEVRVYVGGTGGDDRLETGAGRDFLIGGGGADTFVVSSLASTGPTGFDFITDFQHGVDRIDLSGLAGSAIAIGHANGVSTLYFAPDPSGVSQGVLQVTGDVEAGDLLNAAGTPFYIQGSAAAETLVGGDVGDVINGGGGADVLLGGAGGDWFGFSSLDDSSAAAPARIADLQAEDVIFLAGIDADPTLAGDQAFTRVAAFDSHPGELMLAYDPGQDMTSLSLDADGDGVAEFILLINGSHVADAGIFL